MLQVDHTSSREDIVALLKLGGLSPRKMNRTRNGKKPRKTFEDLCKEIQDRDVILTWDTELKRIVRHAVSCCLLIVSPQGVLLETLREYPNNGDRVRYTQPFSLRGTKRRDEDPLTGIVRETKEEVNIDVPKEEVRELTPFPTPNEHESSVYYGILSRTLVYYFMWETDRILKKRFRPKKDNNTIVSVSWFKKRPQELELRILKKILHSSTVHPVPKIWPDPVPLASLPGRRAVLLYSCAFSFTAASGVDTALLMTSPLMIPSATSQYTIIASTVVHSNTLPDTWVMRKTERKGAASG